MPKLSVSEAAERLGVSPIRVRQRIDDGSLVGEKVGGRWLVDLAVIPQTNPRGRPVKPESVWDAIRRVHAAERLKRDQGGGVEEALRLVYTDAWQPSAVPSYRPDLIRKDGSVVEVRVSRSSRRRALIRLLQASGQLGEGPRSLAVEALLRWLGGRAKRRLFRVAPPDFADLHDDPRVIPSGLSDTRSGMQDPRVIEGYVASSDLDDIINDYWLEPPGVDAAPAVVLHVAPGRPDTVTPLMLAADLSEYEGARERARAIELAEELLR